MMSCPVAHAGSDQAKPPGHPTKEPTEHELEDIPQPPPRYLGGNLQEVDPSFVSKSFWRLATIYGPIFKLDLVKATSIVISNYEYMNEVCDQERFVM